MSDQSKSSRSRRAAHPIVLALSHPAECRGDRPPVRRPAGVRNARSLLSADGPDAVETRSGARYRRGPGIAPAPSDRGARRLAARAQKLPPEERSEIARKAAMSRWHKDLE